MCGRYSIGPDIAAMAEQLQAAVYASFNPRYNAAPSQSLPVVANHHRRQVSAYQWGIVPFWAQDQPNPKRLINARAETVDEKATFKQAFARQRCLVLADGYYEWKKTGEGKVPYRIVLRNHQPFVFAGLWSTHAEENGGDIHDFCIITTEASESVADIHDRMPVILASEYWDFWLSDTEDTEGLKSVLQPYPPDELKAFPVAKTVNNVQHDEPGLVEAINSK